MNWRNKTAEIAESNEKRKSKISDRDWSRTQSGSAVTQTGVINYTETDRLRERTNGNLRAAEAPIIQENS